MAIRFGTSEWQAAMAVESTHAGIRSATGVVWTHFQTPAGFDYIGELNNEDKITLGGEGSAELSIEGYYPEKDGLPACLLAAEAVSSRGANLTTEINRLEITTRPQGQADARLRRPIVQME